AGGNPACDRQPAPWDPLLAPRHPGTAPWRLGGRARPAFYSLHARSLTLDAVLRGAHASLYHPAPQTRPRSADVCRRSSGRLSDSPRVYRRGGFPWTEFCAIAWWLVAAGSWPRLAVGSPYPAASSSSNPNSSGWRRV